MRWDGDVSVHREKGCYMKAVLQRVTHARVEIDGRTVGDCGKGLMILLGVAVGIFSMVKFLLSALAGLERLENEQKNKNKK